MDGREVAIQKYNAIAKANRTMFIVVAIASVVISAAVVLSILLAQKIAFRSKIIAKQSETLTAIDNSVKNIEKLKKEVQSLQSNDALKDSRANEEDNALRVILDALPADANTEAIGASLRNNILDVPGIVVESISVDPIAPESTDSTSTTSDTSTDAGVGVGTGTGTGTESSNAISSRVKTANFSFTVSATSSGDDRTARKVLTELLEKMEKSIRTFTITDFSVEMTSADKMSLKVNGQAFYLPKYTLQLTSETIKSSEGAASKSSSSSTSNSGGK